MSKRKNKDLSLLHRVNEIDLIYRNEVEPMKRPRITSSQSAYEVLIALWDMNRIELLEEFKILLLDCRMRCLGVMIVAQGGFDSCFVDIRIVFAAALKARASQLILAHNHPSCNVRPSEADKKITREFSEAGKMLNIGVEDHLIVSPYDYYSMREEGDMEETVQRQSAFYP
jgi:DNA repair protein RadC